LILKNGKTRQPACQEKVASVCRAAPAGPRSRRRPVDLLTPGDLPPKLRETILADAQPI